MSTLYKLYMELFVKHFATKMENSDEGISDMRVRITQTSMYIWRFPEIKEPLHHLF